MIFFARNVDSPAQVARLTNELQASALATSGIGLHTAEIFVAEGAKIIIAGRRAPEGEALAKKLGPNCIFRQTDVTVEAQMKALIALSVEPARCSAPPMRTSPVTGEIFGRLDSSRRTYRWLFNALHSFDFQLLLTCRPAWDIVVWLLSILGTIVSVSGVVIGWRYLRGKIRFAVGARSESS